MRMGQIDKTLTEDLYLQEVVDFVPIAATLDDLTEDIGQRPI